MVLLKVKKHSPQGRIARLLISYGKIENIGLEESEDIKESLLIFDDRKTEIKHFPTILNELIKSSPLGYLLIPTKDGPLMSTMNSWIDFAFQRNFTIVDIDSLKSLDNYIVKFSFFAGNSITVADLVLFVSIYNTFRNMTTIQLNNGDLTNLVRWFDHIQHLPDILNNFGDMPIIPFEKDMTLVNELLTDITITNKDETKSCKKRGSTTSENNNRPIDDVTRLCIRVGLVKVVERHPEADRLYCLEIDLGDEVRSICSGLVDYLQPEQILNKKVLVIANMKPKTLRGKPSNGMVLCCSNKDLGLVELLEAPEHSEIGEIITWDGYTGKPDEVLSTKAGKDPFVAIQQYFKCRNRVAYYKDSPFNTTKGPCTCKSLNDGIVS